MEHLRLLWQGGPNVTMQGDQRAEVNRFPEQNHLLGFSLSPVILSLIALGLLVDPLLMGELAHIRSLFIIIRIFRSLVTSQEEVNAGTLNFDDGVKASQSHDRDCLRIVPTRHSSVRVRWARVSDGRTRHSSSIAPL